MSKRKKSYDRAEYENNYYNNRLIDSNYVGNNFNPYLNTKFQFNNFNDIYNNLNNIMDVLNNVDINNLNNIFSLLSNGFDINNNFNVENKTNNIFDEIHNKNEIIINFLNSLKPLLGIEFGNIIDRFIDFYMEEINSEKGCM
ncbi:hypothetical protein SFBM_0306 [Candidatus Arthromitus sp. SFB-mouse-Japan]|uniref:hypothetical protein n=1 Tax=unclassified Candidatus Neoarthromitus TaxID=2638829 RepID=UPI00021B7D76|nr:MULTISPECIES: hypothetical protein [unclassified Candidatus Arthromitus]AID44245.1 Hypothetical protein SFBmNL_00326 [Candidatus Arthromitus sp. SFB-mouse-NL]EIA24418.1 hypothetical protein SFB2_085G3 [Candidatus Arthromitus sp. SFB-2]BAK56085.1 hypothetical protein SFBM_0306 [Candidatus Arthromitus sp. SFB-mouse-Japan]